MKGLRGKSRRAGEGQLLVGLFFLKGKVIYSLPSGGFEGRWPPLSHTPLLVHFYLLLESCKHGSPGLLSDTCLCGSGQEGGVSTAQERREAGAPGHRRTHLRALSRSGPTPRGPPSGHGSAPCGPGPSGPARCWHSHGPARGRRAQGQASCATP